MGKLLEKSEKGKKGKKTVRNSPPSRPAFHQYNPNDPQFAPVLDPSAGLSAGLVVILRVPY